MLGDETGAAHMVDRRTLTLPLSAEDVSSLRAGDLVFLNGLLITGRDKVHKYLVEQRPRRQISLSIYQARSSTTADRLCGRPKMDTVLLPPARQRAYALRCMKQM